MPGHHWSDKLQNEFFCRLCGCEEGQKLCFCWPWPSASDYHKKSQLTWWVGVFWVWICEIRKRHCVSNYLTVYLQLHAFSLMYWIVWTGWRTACTSHDTRTSLELSRNWLRCTQRWNKKQTRVASTRMGTIILSHFLLSKKCLFSLVIQRLERRAKSA